jgi:hypothetical protein
MRHTQGEEEAHRDLQIGKWKIQMVRGVGYFVPHFFETNTSLCVTSSLYEPNWRNAGYENTQPTIISRDLDNCLAVFENTIESDIRQGILQRNDETHQRYVNAFRQAYATESIVSMHRQSLSLSLTESNDAATGTPESSNYFVSPDTSSREMLDRMMTTQAFPDAQDYQGSGYHGTGNVPGYISPSFSFPMLSVNGPSLQTLQSPAIQDLLTDMPLNSFTVDGTLQSTLTSEEPSLGFPSITDANNALNSRTTQQNSTDILDQNLDLDEFITMAFDWPHCPLLFHNTLNNYETHSFNETKFGGLRSSLNIHTEATSLMITLKGELQHQNQNADRNQAG